MHLGSCKIVQKDLLAVSEHADRQKKSPAKLLIRKLLYDVLTREQPGDRDPLAKKLIADAVELHMLLRKGGSDLFNLLF